MKNTTRCLCFAAVLLLVAACTTTQEPAATGEATVNPFVGTWVLNLEKSSFNPPSTALKSETVVIEAQDNGLKFVFDNVDAEGNASHFEEAPKFDGQRYPVTGAGSTEMVTMKKTGDSSFEQVVLRDGEEVETVQVALSADGMTSTATINAKDENGQEATSTLVYDKQ
jgi:hypothetical protein